MRSVSLNSQYFVLFRNSRDKRQLVTLGSQMFPETPHILYEILERISKERSRAYIVVNTNSEIKDSLRICSGIFPGEDLYFYEMLPIKGRKSQRNEKQLVAECRIANLIEI